MYFDFTLSILLKSNLFFYEKNCSPVQSVFLLRFVLTLQSIFDIRISIFRFVRRIDVNIRPASILCFRIYDFKDQIKKTKTFIFTF